MCGGKLTFDERIVVHRVVVSSILSHVPERPRVGVHDTRLGGRGRGRDTRI